MTIYHWLTCGVALLVLKVAVNRVLSLRTAFAKIKDYPGRIPLWLDPFSLTVVLLGANFPRPGMCGHYAAKFSLYEKFGATSYTSVLMSTAQPHFWVADAEAAKVVVSDRYRFQKNVIPYGLVRVYGENIITAEGSSWKRHRSIAMSAFNEENVALVWSDTMRLVNEWFEQLDVAGPDVTVDMLLSMKRMALLVIASAGFGTKLSFNVDSVAELLPDGCKQTFQSAILNSMDNIIFRALIPRWFYTFSSLIKVPYLSDNALFVRHAYDDLRTHMLDLVASVRPDIISGKRCTASGAALLRNLIEANTSQDGDSKRLTDDELLSNIFVFLLAGYETTAHTLSFAFVLLALHTDCQEKIYEEVSRAWPGDVDASVMRSSHKEYMDKLEYTAACIRETLRLFPVVPRLQKDVHADTTLPGTYFTPATKVNPSAETGNFSIAVPVGSVVALDIWALHTNVLYWGEDVADFRPERFIDTELYQWPRNAYLPFSGGARSFIGQRFSHTEMVGIVARIVHKYRILVPDDVADKPFEEQKEALLAWKISMMLTPTNARVKLCRRV